MTTTPVYDWDTMLARAEQAEKTARAVLVELSLIQVTLPAKPVTLRPWLNNSLLSLFEWCLNLRLWQLVYKWFLGKLLLFQTNFRWFPSLNSRNLKSDTPNARAKGRGRTD